MIFLWIMGTESASLGEKQIIWERIKLLQQPLEAPARIVNARI